jgi:hypothetical protein
MLLLLDEGSRQSREAWTVWTMIGTGKCATQLDSSKQWIFWVSDYQSRLTINSLHRQRSLAEL